MDFAQVFSLVAAGALAVGGAGLSIGRWARARHLLDTPTSRIRSAAQGYVELVGILRELAVPQPVAPLKGPEKESQVASSQDLNPLHIPAAQLGQLLSNPFV